MILKLSLQFLFKLQYCYKPKLQQLFSVVYNQQCGKTHTQ